LPAAAEQKELGVEREDVSLGKFKDVKSLLSAYNSLQAEFTKRCQRLKELETESAVDKEVTPTKTEEITAKTEEVLSSEKKEFEDERILKEYLKGILKVKPKVAVLSDVGTGLKTPTEKPKNVSEAGRLAKEMFAKTNE